MYMSIVDNQTGKLVIDPEILMDKAGLDFRLGFEDIGLQGDGTPVVFDKCGNFGYLDPVIYSVSITFDE